MLELSDYRFRHLKLRTGEIVIDKIESVEDTKGNNGVAGTLDYDVDCLLRLSCYR